MVVEAMTKDVVGQVDAKIAKQIDEQIKSRLSQSLLSKLDIDSVVNKAIKNIKD